jgi:hypothetical protein
MGVEHDEEGLPFLITSLCKSLCHQLLVQYILFYYAPIGDGAMAIPCPCHVVSLLSHCGLLLLAGYDPSHSSGIVRTKAYRRNEDCGNRKGILLPTLVHWQATVD